MIPLATGIYLLAPNNFWFGVAGINFLPTFVYKMLLLSALTSERDLHFLSPVAESEVILAMWFILALCTFPV